MAAGSAAVLSSFIINLCVCIACFTTFTILRVRPWAKRFFASRRYAKDIDLRPKRLPTTLIGWVWPLLTYAEGDIIDEIGLDGAMYLRILMFGVQFFFVAGIWTISVVLPANMSGGEIDRLLALAVNCVNATTNTSDPNAPPPPPPAPPGAEDPCTSVSTTVNGREYKFTDFDKYSLANIESGSPKMWAHLVSIYVIVLFMLWNLWRYNKSSVYLRLLFLGNSKRGGPSHTVLVTDIPGVSHAVDRAGESKLARAMTFVKSLSRKKSTNNAEAEGAYVEMPSQPEALPVKESEVGIVVTGVPVSQPPPGLAPVKTVTIRDPKESLGHTPSLAHATSGKLAPQTSEPITPRKLAPAASVDTPTRHEPESTPRGAKGLPSTSPFADAAAHASVASGDEGGDTPGAPSMRRSKSLMSPAHSETGILKGGKKYRLVDDSVDPQYKATGGKLVLQRVGLTKEQILEELEEVEPEDLSLILPPHLGVDIRPVPVNRRTNKRYQYDVRDRHLDPEQVALDTLRTGVTPQQMVARTFAMIYQPHNVAAVNMILDTTTLEPLVAEWNSVVQSLEDYLDMAKLRLKLRKRLAIKEVTVRVGGFEPDFEYARQFTTRWWVKVNAVEYWLARLKYLRERIKEEQAVSSRRLAPSSFVTMNTRVNQAVGASSLMSHSENAWRVQNAPAPFEVFWKNLSMTYTVRSSRTTILWALFWLMALFYMIPVAAIQAMIEVPKLASVPVLGDIVTAPVVRQLLEGILPGLILKIFIAILPYIVRVMCILSGMTSESEIDFAVVKRVFLFQVVAVFFGSIIAGSFFNQLKQWAENPSGIISTLGKSIPMTSTFFITYIMVNGLAVASFFFIRVPELVIFYILTRFAGSPRERQRLWTYQYTDYGKTVADHTTCVLLGLVFSCINPIICFTALAYFLVFYVGDSYNNIYVFRRLYESGGRLWQTVYNQIMTCIYIMLLVMFGLLSIKKFPFVFLLIPLIIFCVSCHITTLALFSRPWSVTALYDAAEMDMLEADSRRMELMRDAKEERKKKREKRRKAREAALRKAEDEGLPPPSDTETPLLETGGRAERLLHETLNGDGFAMTMDEKAEVEAMYRNPVFKVKLGDVEGLGRLAEEVMSRLPRLNEWVTQYKRYQAEVRVKRLANDTDLPPPPKMPEDLTIFDDDNTLLDSDDDDDKFTNQLKAMQSEPSTSV